MTADRLTADPRDTANWAIDSLTRGERWMSAVAVLSAVVGVGIAIGMSVPLVSLVLERAGYSAFTIGMVATLYSAAMMVTTWMVPWLIRTVGGVRAVIFGIVGAAIFTAVFPFVSGLAAWILIRILTGVTNAWNWVASEVWVNRLATGPGGGRLIGFYATSFAAGLTIGPLILVFTGTQGALPFLVTSGLMLISVIPVLLVRHLAPPLEKAPPRGAVFRTIRVAPLVIIGGIVCGTGEGVMFALFPPWAVNLGLTEALAVLTVTAVAAGQLGLQPLIGWLAERNPVPRLMAVAAVLTLVGLAALPLVTVGAPSFWIALFVVGGFNAGFYTLSLVLVGRRFDPATLASANAAFISAYTFGMIIGPAIGGAAQDLMPPHGVLVPLVGINILFLAIYAVRRLRPIRPTGR